MRVQTLFPNNHSDVATRDESGKYCAAQTILVTRFGPKREPTMFPNTAFKAKAFERLMLLMWGRKPRRKR